MNRASLKTTGILAAFFLLFSSTLFSCESHSFDSDKRQIIAKDEIRSKLHNIRGYDITRFAEDTINDPPDTNFQKVIRYSLDIQYTDSNKVIQQKKAFVYFAPGGTAIIRSEIVEK
jgi:hypothetical protein